MARNEDGEFELILGNKQLLSVFFLVVLLLGLCFVGGYVLGRGAAPVLNASNTTALPESTKQVEVAKAPAPVAEKESSVPEPAPTQTAPQREEPAPAPAPEPPKPEPVKAKAETPKAETKSKELKAKAEPPKATKQPPATSQPVAGRVYLQLSATDKVKAETMVDLLRSRNLPGIAAAITERPGLYRVLVGPTSEAGVNDLRGKLKSAGFPADQAIKRTF